MISCRVLYAIGIFLGILAGSTAFLGILPDRAGIVFVALVAAYVPTVAYYCHEIANHAPPPSPPA